jgi:hypothetical protein
MLQIYLKYQFIPAKIPLHVSLHPLQFSSGQAKAVTPRDGRQQGFE